MEQEELLLRMRKGRPLPYGVGRGCGTILSRGNMYRLAHAWISEMKADIRERGATLSVLIAEYADYKDDIEAMDRRRACGHVMTEGEIATYMYGIFRARATADIISEGRCEDDEG